MRKTTKTDRPMPPTTLMPPAHRAEASARCSAVGRATLLMLGVLCLAGCNEHPQPGSRGLPRWWLEGSDQAEPMEPPGRQAEVDAYNAQLYAAQGFEVLATTVTQEGQHIDWVADGSMAGFYDTPPPKSKDIPLPKGAERQRTELDEHPELVGPAGTIPVYRNQFEGYVSGESGASSLQDYLDHHQVMGRIDGEKRLYAGLRADTPNKGAVGWVNAFEGAVEADTFGLIELAVFCEGAHKDQTLEQIGIVASRDRHNFQDGLLRLHVEFITAGPGQLGTPNKGGWDQAQLGFQPAAGRRYFPGVQLRGSTLGGQQEEARFEIRLFEGRWWLGYNGDWLGSYDASLFTLMKTGACGAAWYGEVFDPTPDHWTTTGMGSGHFPDQGYGNVSWVSNPVLYKDTSGFWTSPVDANIGPMDPACYTRTALAPRGSGLPPWFFLGGPGGKVSGCR